MGVYNPHAPRILGQEWVPIRDQDLVFSPVENAYEIGHTFTPTSAHLLQDGRFYVKKFPPAGLTGRVMTVSVYPTGYENSSGPIKSVLIPVNNGGITGNFVFNDTTTVADALWSSADSKYIFGNVGNGVSCRIGMYFAVNQYAQTLMSKRIVGVNLVYMATFQMGGATTQQMGPIYISGDSIQDSWAFSNLQTTPTSASSVPDFFTCKFGEVNVMDVRNAAGLRTPWTYPQLQRFEQSAGATRRSALISFSASSDPGGVYSLQYAALQVLYCEEQRVAVGMRSYAMDTSSLNTPDATLVQGVNAIPLLTPAGVANPSLASGTQYTVTLAGADIGDAQQSNVGVLASATYPILNADLELYSLPTNNVGVQVNLTTTLDQAYTKQGTHTLPQLTLHTSGGPLNSVHVYGQQAKAPVYGSITATQNILDSAAGGAASWPQVRFYARRFGNTTVPLTLDSPSITGSSVSISVSDFDALDEIIDGWKEVTLRFTTAPTMGAGTNPTWRWSATGENVGNQWQILGATAPALSGVPGNLLNLAPSTQRLDSATYGQPSAGSTIELSWLSPAVTAVTADSTSDAVLIFAQDLPAVSGMAATGAVQSISGIGQDCGGVPCCVPSGINYTRITWSPTSSSIPVSGFGYYELQRMDTLTDWQTIMKATAPAASGFSDFESRVGITTSYRIRAVDVLGFANSWSGTVTAPTIAAPGLTGSSCVGQGHSLIFTSNERQDGSINLGYASIWDNAGQIAEDFTFPEAGFTVLQPMYGKDFYTAFRPLERGGSQFTRTVLVQAAAISPETLPDFTSLRDMAWDTVSYICVRDEDGNRWFANVTVPSGRVQLNRTLYMAPVTITEVTDTASQPDPSS